MFNSDENRSPTIDYLRAISILWVLGYHLLPLKIFSHGTYGVLLFFIISGYCISLSSATARSSWHFYSKRIGRLMPALVVCSLITTAFKHAEPWLIEPDRIPTWTDTFYSWIGMPTLDVLKVGYRAADGAYWSLIFEFKFYVLVFLFMLIGLRRYLVLAFCFFLIIRVWLGHFTEGNFVDLYPYFIAGMSIAALRGNQPAQGIFGLVFAVAADGYFLAAGYTQSSVPIELSRSLALWSEIALMAIAVWWKPPTLVCRLLAPFAFIGLVSYPLYLIHQDVSIMTFKLLGIPHDESILPISLRILFIFFVLIPLSAIIHYRIEIPAIPILTSLLAGRKRLPTITGSQVALRLAGGGNERTD